MRLLTPDLAPHLGKKVVVALLPHLSLSRKPAGVNVGLERADELRLEHNLVAEVQHGEDDQAEVGDEEVADAPGDESGEALGKDDEDVEEEAVVSEPRLAQARVGQRLAADTTGLKDAHEGDLASVDAAPGDETSNTGNVHEPVEDLATAAGNVHEGEKTESRGKGHTPVRNTLLGGLGEELGRTARVSKTDDHTGTRVNVGVGGG